MYNYIMSFSAICVILCAGGLISYGFSVTDTDISNITSYFLEGPIGKDSDVFRQLLNQETLIRMSLVKNVHSLMQDMVTMKQDMVTLKESMALLQVSTSQEINNLKTKVDQLERENKRLDAENGNIRNQFSVVSDTFEAVDMNFTQIKDDFKEFELHYEQNRVKYEQNTSGILSDIKVEVRYLSVTLLNLHQHTMNLEKNIPILFEENNRSMLEWVNDTFWKFDGDLSETNERQERYQLALSELENRQNTTKLLKDDVNITINTLQENIQKCASDYSQLSLTVSALELLHLKKSVGFTVGISSSDSSWSGSTLVFPTVLFEVGGGYNANTGIFTSPIDGHFVFYISIQSYYKKDIYFDIVMNGVSKVRAMAERGPASTNVYLTGTNMVLLRLTKGYKVWVKRYSGSGYYSYAIPVMTFSGFHVF